MSSSTSWNQATANGSVSPVPSSWTREPTLADQLQLQLQQAEMQPELKNPDATEDRSQPTRTVQLPLKSRGKHCAIGNISCVRVVGQNNVGNIFLQLDSDLQNNALNSGVPEWVGDPLWRRHADMRHGQPLPWYCDRRGSKVTWNVYKVTEIKWACMDDISKEIWMECELR